MSTLNTFSPTAGSRKAYHLPRIDKGSTLIVVGAGAFGGWTALHALREGLKVTLVDTWGPGNARASSGDETRVIRSTYGANETYFDMNVRALTLWKENEQRFNRKLFFNTGVLWLCYNESAPIVDDSVPYARKHGMPYEYLTPRDVATRYPVVRTSDLHHAFYDPYGGYLKAREACQAVCEAFVAEGGRYIQGQAAPGKIRNGKLENIRISEGTPTTADAYVFACGAWLPSLFPDLLQSVITCTRQEVYYFGTPAADAAVYENLPVWVDVDGQDFYYGIPGNSHRGFKLGVDIRGKIFDPTAGERLPDAHVLATARRFIEHRFPGMTNAPLLESRVCPYENSPDGNFVVDVHPAAANLMLVGGGSGHGFKHGPALGEWVAQAMIHGTALPEIFRPSFRAST